jgi:hypothetical protein
MSFMRRSLAACVRALDRRPEYLGNRRFVMVSLGSTRPPLSSTYPTRTENVEARDAADRLPTLIVILPIRPTLPFLPRFTTGCLYETMRACKQMTNMHVHISAGVEFNPPTLVTNEQALLCVP